MKEALLSAVGDGIYPPIWLTIAAFRGLCFHHGSRAACAQRSSSCAWCELCGHVSERCGLTVRTRSLARESNSVANVCRLCRARLPVDLVLSGNCVFRTKPDTDSGAIRTPIPIQSGQ